MITMFKNILFLVLVLSVNSAFSSQKDSGLYAEALKVLKMNKPDFKVFEKSVFDKKVFELDAPNPMLTLGDYNADGVKDFVFYGVNMKAKRTFIYLLLSSKSKKTYKVYEVEKEIISFKTLRRNPYFLSTGFAKELSGLKRDTIQVDVVLGEDDYGATLIYYYSLSDDKVKAFKGLQD